MLQSYTVKKDFDNFEMVLHMTIGKYTQYILTNEALFYHILKTFPPTAKI